jgi:hypothetical protein
MTTTTASVSARRAAIARENARADAYLASVENQTNRFIKAIVEAAKLTEENTPVVGGGANVYGYSDVMAHTVISVNKTGTVAIIQRDTATLLNGHGSDAADKLSFEPGGFCGHTSGRQRYSYERNPNGETLRITLRAKGQHAGTWRTKGAGTGAARVRFGTRSEHCDFNF